MFPVGLYATLLVGLFGVTFPELLAPVESVARTAVTLPLRAYSILFDARPALAAAAPDPQLAPLAGQSASTMRGARGPRGFTPKVLRVVDRRVGPLGVVDELILARTRGELRGCALLVTAGPGLVGFLDLDPDEPTRRDTEAEASAADAFDRQPARVRLLHYRPRRRTSKRPMRAREPFAVGRVAAQVTCREVDAQGMLHFLVVPARAVDSWPLRCTMLDDSYLGSRLRHSGDLVTTRATPPDSGNELPAGLHIGRLMIWGYPQLNIPVGLFVEPILDPRGISSVVVWQAADGGSVPDVSTRDDHWLPVRLARFPAPRPARERWLVTSDAGTTLPDGAALVDRGRLLGTLAKPWSGQSLVTPFSSSTKTWALLLRSGDGRVHEIVGRVVGRGADGRLRVKVIAPESAWQLGGELSTGVNGPHCPAGLAIGRAEPGDGRVQRTSSRRTPGLFAHAAERGEWLVTIAEADVANPHVFVAHESDGVRR
jgi:hypothetical protein